MSNLEMEAADHTPSISEGQIPACQKCGRQDETLRLVSYPYVISLVVITFRRAFAGLWCKTHRRQNQIIAGLISAIFGWLGFPFGFIFTPLALFQLARGGEQPADVNIQILSTLAEDKLKRGDKEGAIKCLEEALIFREVPEIQGRLRQLRSQYATREEPAGCLPLGMRLLGGILISLLIGTVVGVLDYTSGWIQYMLFGGVGEIYFVLAILSYAPLLVAIYIAGIGLAAVIEGTLLRIRARKSLLAISFAVMAGSVCMYGIFEGNTMMDLTFTLINNQFESLAQFVFVGIVNLFIGGLVWVALLFENLGANTVYLAILLMGFGFFLILGIAKARDTIRWHQRIKATHLEQ